MMHTQTEIVQLLESISELMILKEESPFKVRAFMNARNAIESLSNFSLFYETQKWSEIEGIGASIEKIIQEYCVSHTSQFLEELKKDLPDGLLELMQLKGVGKKTALKLIEKAGVHSIDQLEQIQDGLVNFGFTTHQQEKIQRAVSVYRQQQNLKLWSDLKPHIKALEKKLQDLVSPGKLLFTGQIRLESFVISEIFLLIDHTVPQQAVQDTLDLHKNIFKNLPIHIEQVPAEHFDYHLLRTTGPAPFFEALKIQKTSESEHQLLQKAKLPWIEPILRENPHILEAMQSTSLLQVQNIQGVFHVHTTYSDGKNSLEQIIQAALERNFAYIGISDHSQSAKYANGLDIKKVFEQKQHLQKLQIKYPAMRIFFGVESDILADGSLDYPEEILKDFDFVIASIHSRMGMTKQEMTQRIKKAIQNPFTRFIGHLTGRLLIKRAPYEIDVEELIQEASIQNVAIELNCASERMDFDWSYGSIFQKTGCYTSLNPDAHSIEELDAITFGAIAAQKSLIPVQQFVNTKDVQWVEEWIHTKQMKS